MASRQAQASPQTPPPLPPLDLGQTNIRDGEGQPGVILEIISLGEIADHLTDDHGEDAPGRNHQRIASVIIHPILTSKAVVWGAHPGLEVLLPVSRVDNAFVQHGGRGTGLGDLTIGPFLQWGPADPVAGSVSARFGLQIVAPTGDYRASRPVNVGQGAWQVSPYMALTWRATHRWEVSARGIYDRSGSADQTADGATASTRAGAMAALDLSVSYAATDSFRLGVGGYGLWQLTDPQVAGVPVAAMRERVYALGPVTEWRTRPLTVLGAIFAEQGARNRPEGVMLNLRLQHPF